MAEKDSSKRGPDATAYAVRDFERGGKQDSSWLKVGSVWKHDDGDGFNVVLDAMPVSGKIVVRTNKPKGKE
jgi:hypothetical protein